MVEHLQALLEGIGIFADHVQNLYMVLKKHVKPCTEFASFLTFIPIEIYIPIRQIASYANK